MRADEESVESRRMRILQFIKEHPGAHLRDIKRRLELAMGVIQYNLYRLERERLIVSRRQGLYKRFYPNLVFGDEQLEILNVISQETERDILLYLVDNSNVTQKEISEYARISASTVNWHMKRLIDSGIVNSRHEGLFVRYALKVNETAILTLLKAYHPRIWERLADRLADTLTEVSDAASVGKNRGGGKRRK